MLLSAPYLFAASYVATLVDGGASKWLYVIFLVSLWNALKFLANGIVCMGLLARVRVHERRLQKSAVEASAVHANEQFVGA